MIAYGKQNQLLTCRSRFVVHYIFKGHFVDLAHMNRVNQVKFSDGATLSLYLIAGSEQ